TPHRAGPPGRGPAAAGGPAARRDRQPVPGPGPAAGPSEPAGVRRPHAAVPRGRAGDGRGRHGRPHDGERGAGLRLAGVSAEAEGPPRAGTRRLLAEHGVRPDTDLGQHFLLDENLADLAVRRGRVGPDDVVLEVGPGLGTLPPGRPRGAAGARGIETDEPLRPALESVLEAHDNVRLRFADAMRVDLAALDPAPTRVVANLPYSIATPLVLETLWQLPGVGAWCVMVQREVADRWLAPPGSRLYGAPSVLLQLAARQTFLRAVGPPAVLPRPRVQPPPPRRVGAGRAGAGRARPRPRGALARACGVRDSTEDAGERPLGGRARPGAGRAGAGRARHAAGRPGRGASAGRLPRAGAGAFVGRLTLAAPAKLNLRLLVGPRGADGYHPVRSLIVALPDLADTVTVERAAERSVACEGMDGPANLAWHALDALERRVGALPPLAVRI